MNSNLKCQDLPKFSFSGEGVGTPDQLELKVPRSAQIFIFGGGEEWVLKYLSGGTQGILNTNLSHWS